MRNFNTLPRRSVASVTLLAAVGGAVLAGCGSEYEVSGTALQGGDGKTYVVPADSFRPVYPNKDSCKDDVKAHNAAIKAAIGAELDPDKACQPVKQYKGQPYPQTYYYGPLLNRSQEWQSTEMVTWTPVKGGTEANFAAKNEPLQHDVAKAPKGVELGKPATVTEHVGGFTGDDSEGGFHEPGGIHGGGGVHEGGEGGHVGHVGGVR